MKPVFLSTILLFFCIVVPCALTAQQKHWKSEVRKQKSKEEQVKWILNSYDKYGEEQLEMLDTALRVARQSGIDTLVATVHRHKGWLFLKKTWFELSWNEFVTARYILLKAKSYKNIATVMYGQGTVLLTQGMGDSLLAFLKKNQALVDATAATSGRLRWNALYPLAYQQMNKLDMARAAMEKQLPEIEASMDTPLILSGYINLGRHYDDFDSSMALYSKGLAMATNYPDKHTELLVKIGYAYTLRDDKLKDSALYYFFEAEKNSYKLHNPGFRCNISSLIGDFFMNRSENALALPYLRKAYECSKDMGGLHTSTGAHNLAVCFIGLKQIDSAAVYLNIHKEMVDRMSNDYETMLYYHAKAEFEALKTGDSCSMDVLQNYDKALGLAVKADEDRIALTMLITAMGCVAYNDPAKMKPIAMSLLKYSGYYYNRIRGQDMRKYRSVEFLQLYAKLESVFGDKAKANALYEELVDQMRVIEEGNYVKGLGEAVVKYKSDLKDAEISLLNERQKAATIRTILIIAGLLLVIGVAAVIYVLYRREHSTRQMLDERNHKVEQLLREVHHRVKNNLQIVSSFINIQLDKVTDREARSALEDTSTRIMALAGLHQSLYRQDDLSRIQINQYIEELCKVLGTGINQDVEISCDLENLQLNIDQAIPIGLAINELITNALKHAFSQKQHGRISVELKHRDKWQLIVKDNGNGLPENMHPEDLQSIGIRLVQDIAERQLNGTFSFYNESGAVFKIEFVPAAA